MLVAENFSLRKLTGVGIEEVVNYYFPTVPVLRARIGIYSSFRVGLKLCGSDRKESIVPISEWQNLYGVETADGTVYITNDAEDYTTFRRNAR